MFKKLFQHQYPPDMNARVLDIALKSIKTASVAIPLMVATAYTVPHLLPWSIISEDYLHHVPPPVEERHKLLLREVCADMKVDPKNVRLCYNTLNEIYHKGDRTVYDPENKGTLRSPLGCVVKLPKQNTQSNLDAMRINGKPINWDSNFGQGLLKTLTLSDQNIKFIMARELVHIKELHFVYKEALALMFLAATFATSWQMTKRTSGLGATVGRNTGLVCVAYMIWVVSTMQFHKWLVLRADAEAAKLGQSYAEGGVESMRNHLKMMRHFRKAYGTVQEGNITEKGDFHYNIYLPSRIERLKRLKQLSKEMYPPLESVEN